MDDVISSIRGRKIIDSRGDWTIEAEVKSKNGLAGTGAAPSGKSKGEYEAIAIDAEKAVHIANSLLEKMRGLQFSQKAVDSRMLELDGTRNFSKIGGNTAIAMSLAVFNALAKEKTKGIFPYPLGNVLGGGAHGGGLDIQEVLVCPREAKSFPESVKNITGMHHELRTRLEKTGDVGINDEGALTAKLDLHKSLSVVCDVAEDNGCSVGVDVAASELWNGKKYLYKKLGKSFGPEEYPDFIADLAKTYNLFYIEDAFHENDFESFRELTKKIGNRRLVCGDDLTATQPERLKTAIKGRAINAAIVKPNQVGTVSLTHEFVETAKKNKIVPVISHRSGETMDSTISRMALDWSVPIIKAGVVDVRIAKLDRLLEMWDKCVRPKMNKELRSFFH